MEFYLGKFTKNEPRSFWLLTVGAAVIVVLIIVGLIWFWNSGHEIIEPIHDNHPQTSITKTQNNMA